MIPSVDFAYPPMGSNAVQFPPQFFYPDFMKGTLQRREDRETFQVILTNQRAERWLPFLIFLLKIILRTFAFCFKFLTQPQHSSLCSMDSGIDTLIDGTKTGLNYVWILDLFICF
jgi:hypothetical protein